MEDMLSSQFISHFQFFLSFLCSDLSRIFDPYILGFGFLLQLSNYGKRKDLSFWRLQFTVNSPDLFCKLTMCYKTAILFPVNFKRKRVAKLFGLLLTYAQNNRMLKIQVLVPVQVWLRHQDQNPAFGIDLYPSFVRQRDIKHQFLNHHENFQ